MKRWRRLKTELFGSFTQRLNWLRSRCQRNPSGRAVFRVTPDAQSHQKILVVDDEPDLEPLVLQRMRRQIRRGEYEFVFAHDGVEALEMLTLDKEIDMVVSDINMPRMDGLTLLQQIQDVSPDIRAIIISAYGDMENIRTAMNRGAFDFVTKPLDFQDPAAHDPTNSPAFG